MNATRSFAICGLATGLLAGGPGVPVACAASEEVAIVGTSTSPWARPRLFIASRDAVARSGDVVAWQDGSGDAPASLLWSAAGMLQARSPAQSADRLVLSAAPEGISLRWNLLTPAQRDATRVSQAWLERLQAAPLGEIRNANLWFMPRRAASGAPTARRAMVYAGAADGMLHGFDAEDGSERIAYLPRASLARMAGAAADTPAPAVDGPVFAADAPSAPDGREHGVLVGALGAAGKGFFVLDIGDPAQFAAAAPTALVVTDQTASADPDLGHIYGPPVTDDADPNRSRQIVRLNDGRWAAVMGNGYFSTAERPVLLIQYLDEQNRDPVTGARELRKLSPCQDGQACVHQGRNGLAPPRLLDVDGNGTVDLAYAGDLQGRLWKFDLSGGNLPGQPDAAWRVAFGGQPLFVARGADRQPQAITTAPYVIAHPRGGLMLVVGTGRHLSSSDTTSTAVQTLYGLYDDSAMAVADGQVRIRDTQPILAADAAEARPPTLVAQHYTGSSTQDGVVYHHSSSTPVAYGGPQPKRGWYLDLPLAGQRVLQHPRSFEGHKVLVHSVVPAGGGTWLGGASHVSVLNAFSGQPPLQPAFPAVAAHALQDGASMASTPAGPAWGLRLRGSLQLRYADKSRLSLQGGQTTGQRAGWREQP